MMDVLHFPKREGVKDTYWRAYYESVRRKAVAAGIQVIVDKSPEVWCGGSINAYSCTLNGKQFIMDFSDLTPLQVNPVQQDCPYFKWQYCSERRDHMETPNVHPLTPVQDYDWDVFQTVRADVTYKGIGKITNNQRARAAAKYRRAKVRSTLLENYNGLVSTDFMDQRVWWLSHNDASVAVHVPGARNDMLDRGQLELMGLGICVISPAITTVLGSSTRPKRRIELEDGLDFIQCRPDYSNLIERIEAIRKDPDMAKMIGDNARLKFDDIVPPDKYWHYIRSVLNGQD